MVKKILSERCSVSTNYELRITNHESPVLALIYRDREKILLAMPLDLAMSDGHEVCSSVHPRLHCICIANICGLATALSGKAGATV